ncbi:MAG TPA: hypothetical protein VIB07_00085 [Nitrososphaera sp.]|jgi:hypothetical protein
MPYKDADDGHRIAMTRDVIPYAKDLFDKGLQLEAILLAHEYLEQKLNALVRQADEDQHAVHRQFKFVIDMMASANLVSADDYQVLREFNRLRNINANQILNFSLTLKGAKKGDMIKAMNLAEESEKIISDLQQNIERRRKKS